MSKKEIVPNGFSNEMIFNDQSWVIIDASTEYGVSVHFYNQNQSDEYEKFEDYVNAHFDDEFFMGSSSDSSKIVTSQNAKACASEGFETEEYDSGQPRPLYYGKAQLIEAYNGINPEKLPELIKSIEQGLETVENDAAENGKDNSLLSSDPHSYYGVSKKSFY